MERGRTLAFVIVGAVVGGLIGGYPLAWALERLMPYHDRAGGFAMLVAIGFHLGMVYGIAVTFGAMAGACGGWALAGRMSRPALPPRRAV